jgi:hypothetical protein
MRTGIQAARDAQHGLTHKDASQLGPLGRFPRTTSSAADRRGLARPPVGLAGGAGAFAVALLVRQILAHEFVLTG